MNGEVMLADVRSMSGEAGVSPASAAEKLLWFTEQLHPGTRSTVALTHLRVDGQLSQPALLAAIDSLRRRHPALRTAFVASAGQLWRRIPEPRVDVRIHPLPTGVTPQRAVEALCADPYDLAAGEVLRIGLATDTDGADLFLAAHHVAVDGYSEVVIAAELAQAYAAIISGRQPTLPELPRMQARHQTAERRAELVAYWRRALAGVQDLPAGDPLQTHREILRDGLRELAFDVPSGTARDLREQSRARALPLFALLVTAAGTALGELSGATDFCLGVPVSTRVPAQQAEVGCELTVLPIRFRTAHRGQPAAVWDTMIDGILHADLSLPEIIACRPTPDTRRMPVYQAVVAFQNWPRHVHDAGPARLRTIPTSACGPQGEVVVEFYDQPDGLSGVLQAPSAGAWADRLNTLAAAVGQQLSLWAKGGIDDGAAHRDTS